MSNFDVWKATKAAHESAEREYLAARDATISAGNKRGEAWEALVQASRSLSADETKQAIEFEYGPRIASDVGSPSEKP
jgi:hypothetical protein